MLEPALLGMLEDDLHPASTLFRHLDRLNLHLPPPPPAALSKDPEVEMEAAVDPLMVKGSIRNTTAYEIIRMMQAVRDNANKVKQQHVGGPACESLNK